MLNFGAVMKAFDAVMLMRDAARAFKGERPADAPLPPSTDVTTATRATALEATLTNVVVAALKEAFDRDHARLELERAQLDEQRRRAEAAQRLELRRQAADRELARLRLLAGGALVGWIASLTLLLVRMDAASGAARAALALSWCLLLAALAAAFAAQRRVNVYEPDAEQPVSAGAGGTAALWLLVAGLAATAASLLV